MNSYISVHSNLIINFPFSVWFPRKGSNQDYCFRNSEARGSCLLETHWIETSGNPWFVWFNPSRLLAGKAWRRMGLSQSSELMYAIPLSLSLSLFLSLSFLKLHAKTKAFDPQSQSFPYTIIKSSSSIIITESSFLPFYTFNSYLILPFWRRMIRVSYKISHFLSFCEKFERIYLCSVE